MIPFLDFDGVLHPELCPSRDWFERLPVFERWSRRHAHIDVMISSSWCNVVPWRDIIERFSPDIRVRIIGHTPHRADVVESLVPSEVLIFEREAEIFDSCRTHGRLSNHQIAVDDYPWQSSQLAAWREFVPPAIEHYLRSMANGGELQARAQIAAIGAVSGFQ